MLEIQKIYTIIAYNSRATPGNFIDLGLNHTGKTKIITHFYFNYGHFGFKYLALKIPKATSLRIGRIRGLNLEH